MGRRAAQSCPRSVRLARAARRPRPPLEKLFQVLHALHRRHFRTRRHCHPQGLVELGQLLNCWDHSRRWCRRRRVPPQLSAPSTDPATSPPALLLKQRCPQWRSLACSRAARCACLSPSAALYHAASSLPCLTSQGEGVARSRLKAHDVRSFHPGQASSAGSPNADQPSTPPAAAAAHPLATISLRRPRGVR